MTKFDTAYSIYDLKKIKLDYILTINYFKMSYLILTLILIQCTRQILLSMNEKRQRCISKEIDAGDTLHLSFVVTGDDKSERTRVLLFEPDTHTIYQKENIEEGQFQTSTKKPGQYKLCFFSLSGKPHFISFEFYTTYERGHTLNLAKDGK
jgi:hypothetical protein